MKLIYLDYAATSPLSKEVYETYTKLLKDSFANSESIYDIGFKVKRQLDKSRQHIADFFGVKVNDLIFTSGASEANSMAIKGYAIKNQDKGKHLITTKIEHSSVLNSFKQLEENFGFEVTYLEVDKSGLIDLETLKSELRDDTILVSIMHVNNEIGTIQDIEAISKIVRLSKAIFHVDCVQSLGKIEIDFSLFDMASFSAHKLGGLKGSGLLYKKTHLEILPLISGGSQEFGVRGGTSNAAANILLAKTIRLALENNRKNKDKIKGLKQYFVSELQKIDSVVIHSPNDSSDYITSFSCLNVPSEIMMNGLVAKGIYVSARSTCHSNDGDYSYVLQSIGCSEKEMQTVIRISFGYETSKEQLDLVLETVREMQRHVRT